MKIPQDESESFSKQGTSLAFESNQSSRSQNIEIKANKNDLNHKSSWLKFMIIAAIVLVFVIDLNLRSSELQEQPSEEDQNDEEFSGSDQPEIVIFDRERKVQNQPNPQEEMKKLQKQKKEKEAKKLEEQKKQKQKEEEQKKKSEQQAAQKFCTILPKELTKKLFFLYLDRERMPKQQADDFHSTNQKYCHFHTLYEVDFDYIVDTWNFREQTKHNSSQMIDKAKIKKEHKKHLFIFLQLYFWGGIYVDTQLGLKFGDRLSDRFLYQIRFGKELLFGEGEEVNAEGYHLPKREFRTVRAQENFSETLEKMIRKIIGGEDWRDVCGNYQCLIMKKAIKNM